MFFELLFVLFMDWLFKAKLIVFLEDLVWDIFENLNQLRIWPWLFVGQGSLKGLMVANDTIVVSAYVKIFDNIIVNFSDVYVFEFVKERGKLTQILQNDSTIKHKLPMFFLLNLNQYFWKDDWNFIDILFVYALLVQEWVNSQIIIDSSVLWIFSVRQIQLLGSDLWPCTKVSPLLFASAHFINDLWEDMAYYFSPVLLWRQLFTFEFIQKIVQLFVNHFIRSWLVFLLKIFKVDYDWW